MTAIAWAIVLGAGMLAEAIEPGATSEAGSQGAVLIFFILIAATFVEWLK